MLPLGFAFAQPNLVRDPHDKWGVTDLCRDVPASARQLAGLPTGMIRRLSPYFRAVLSKTAAMPSTAVALLTTACPTAACPNAASLRAARLSPSAALVSSCAGGPYPWMPSGRPSTFPASTKTSSGYSAPADETARYPPEPVIPSEAKEVERSRQESRKLPGSLSLTIFRELPSRRISCPHVPAQAVSWFHQLRIRWES